MLILGILLVAAAVVVGYFALAGGSDTGIPIAVVDRTVSLTAVELYAAGAASAVALIAGMTFAGLGARRISAKHQDLRRIRARAAETERAQKEKDKLERRLEAAKARRE